jgi:hypothetical protein
MTVSVLDLKPSSRRASSSSGSGMSSVVRIRNRIMCVHQDVDSVDESMRRTLTRDCVASARSNRQVRRKLARRSWPTARSRQRTSSSNPRSDRNRSGEHAAAAASGFVAHELGNGRPSRAARLLCINSCIIVRVEMHHCGGRR